MLDLPGVECTCAKNKDINTIDFIADFQWWLHGWNKIESMVSCIPNNYLYMKIDITFRGAKHSLPHVW